MTMCVLAMLAALSSGIPVEGLLANFDARDAASLTVEGDHVVSWASTVAPGCIATAEGAQQPVRVARPEGVRRPCVYFDGLDDVLRVSAFDQKAETWTLVVVAAPRTPLRGGAFCSATAKGGHDYDPGFTVDLYQATQAFDCVSVEGAGRIDGQLDQMQGSYACGGFHVVTVVRAADRIDLFVDGTMEGTRPATPAVTVMDELRIGARYYAGMERNYFHGEIAQVLLYGKALDETARASVEAALRVSKEERMEGEQALAQNRVKQLAERMKAPSVQNSWPNVAAMSRELKDLPAVSEMPIRTDLREAIELSVRHLNSLYDADRDNEPFFFVNRQADGTGKMHHSVNIGIPHVVGRCLLGCAMADRDAGVPFPQDGLAILERYCRSSFENEDHLNSYYDPARNGARFIEFHNMREGLYGLWALMVERHSDWARETAHKMLVTLDSITDGEGRWSLDLLKQRGMAERCEGINIPNATRLIDALLAYYDIAQDPLAMKLAGLYAREGLKTVYTPDGHFEVMDKSSGHIHSITSSLSGITDYAIRTNDKDMLDACRRIVEVGVPDYFSSWGWGDEVFPVHPADVVSRGEINQTGDVIRTALLLGGAGYPEYYELAERFLRSMMLPTQHREKELSHILRDKPEPADDSERNTVRRSIGGYAMQLPNDRMNPGDWPISTLDITSGAVHAMSECYRERTVCREGVYRMNLLFDFEDDGIALDSALPMEGRVAFRAKKAVAGLMVRLPKNADQASVHATVAGEAVPVSFDGPYARIGAVRANSEGVLTFDVPCRTEKETVDGTEYTTTWAGSQIVDIKPRGVESPLPF